MRLSEPFVTAHSRKFLFKAIEMALNKNLRE